MAILSKMKTTVWRQPYKDPQNDTSKELGERSVHVDLQRDQIDTLGRSSANNSDADEAIESKTTGKSVGNSETKDPLLIAAAMANK